MTRHRDPTTVGPAVFGIAAAIAHLSDDRTRDRQLHEINPGAWHTTHAATPDTCPHCQDEENPDAR